MAASCSSLRIAYGKQHKRLRRNCGILLFTAEPVANDQMQICCPFLRLDIRSSKTRHQRFCRVVNGRSVHDACWGSSNSHAAPQLRKCSLRVGDAAAISLALGCSQSALCRQALQILQSQFNSVFVPSNTVA